MFLLADIAKLKELIQNLPEGDVLGKMSLESRLAQVEVELIECLNKDEC